MVPESGSEWGGGGGGRAAWGVGLWPSLGRLEGRRPLTVLHPPGTPPDEFLIRGRGPGPRYCQTLLRLHVSLRMCVVIIS